MFDGGDGSTFITIFYLHKLSFSALILLFTITNFFKLCNPISPEQLILFNINNTISNLDNPCLFQKFNLKNITYYNYLRDNVRGGYDGSELNAEDTMPNKILTANGLIEEYDYDIHYFVTDNLPRHLHDFSKPIYEE